MVCSNCFHLKAVIRRFSASYLYLATFVKECPECLGPFIGRNVLVENISAILFSQHFEEDENRDEVNETISIS